MYPKPIQRLIELFTRFPGIGPRQATRFVFYILREVMPDELIFALEGLKKVSYCSLCFRAVEISDAKSAHFCEFCKSAKRDHTKIAVIEKESDMQNLEKTGAYSGLYHVLSGVISPLDSESPKRLHLQQLFERIKTVLEKDDKCEVILATNPTTDGDTTAFYIERVFEPLKKQFQNLKISRLGRGLSLGSELEHVDEVTLKSALYNRK